jgi:two-component system phosphate regulon sensor histidine kinase PhoR
MSFKKDVFTIIIAYVIVIIIIAIFKSTIVTIVFISALMIFHIFGFYGERDKLSRNSEDSLSRLMSKLSKTKKESEESYKRFVSLTQTLGSGLIMVNEEGIINFTNKDFNQYFNIEDTNKKDYNILVEIRPLYKFINEAYLLEKSFREQIQYLDKFYDLVSTPIFEDDLFQGCLIIVHDISSLKTAENFQKQFTADVSHELKTPLSAIVGFSEILTRDTNILDKDRQEFIKLIKKESNRMETILSDLLIISKMDRLDYELNLEKINMKDLIVEYVDSLKNKIIKKGLKYNVQVEDCTLLIDKNKMGQVILNLVKNAINYTDKGEISILGNIEGSKYKLKIIDSGIGIAKEDIDKIFKRFYRVDAARSRDTGGSGLGLSICKNVIRKHGGSILVNSTENKGTTFEIILNIKE